METAAATAHLTARIAAGDAAAFAAFYEAWFDRVRALAASITRRDESFCLDVVQDVMLRVVDRMQPLSDERAVRAWMSRTVLTTALDRLRSERRRARREVQAARPEAVHPEPAALLAAAEQSDWLAGEIARLSPADRLLLSSRFAENGTLDQVGTRLGISGDAAHGRIRRLIERLRDAARRSFT